MNVVTSIIEDEVGGIWSTRMLLLHTMTAQVARH